MTDREMEIKNRSKVSNLFQQIESYIQKLEMSDVQKQNCINCIKASKFIIDGRNK